MHVNKHYDVINYAEKYGRHNLCLIIMMHYSQGNNWIPDLKNHVTENQSHVTENKSHVTEISGSNFTGPKTKVT